MQRSRSQCSHVSSSPTPLKSSGDALEGRLKGERDDQSKIFFFDNDGGGSDKQIGMDIHKLHKCVHARVHARFE